MMMEKQEEKEENDIQIKSKLQTIPAQLAIGKTIEVPLETTTSVDNLTHAFSQYSSLEDTPEKREQARWITEEVHDASMRTEFDSELSFLCEKLNFSAPMTHHMSYIA